MNELEQKIKKDLFSSTYCLKYKFWLILTYLKMLSHWPINYTGYNADSYQDYWQVQLRLRLGLRPHEEGC